VADCTIHKLIADVAVIAEDQVLMLRYSDGNKYDHQAGWFLPDDLLRHLEHPDAAAKRILQDQVGVETAPGALFLSHIESFQGKDGTWHLAFHYVTQFETLPEITMSNDIDSFEWFYLDQLPLRAEVAHHGWALDTIREILKRAS
jgi:ADP-ribose pyrophosphatase YjhB (NUDIX family)